MMIAQRRKDKDIDHLPEKRDKSKEREDRKKHHVDEKDPDFRDTVNDPDLRVSRIAGRIAGKM